MGGWAYESLMEKLKNVVLILVNARLKVWIKYSTL